MVKVLAVLYPGGEYAKDEPKLLGTTENALGLRDLCDKKGWELIINSDKEGPDSVFHKEIETAEFLITTPFHSGYLTSALAEKAKNLKICVTAGVGSDHVDLDACNKKKIGVYEVTGSNVVSVAEHVVLLVLSLVKNFVPAHEQVMAGDWNVAAIARDAFDLEGKVVGTLGCGRIGFRVLQRLKAFDCKELLYYDYAALPEAAANEVGAKRVGDLKDFLSQVDILMLNCPLHDTTRGMINKNTLAYLKPGAWIVNTARGALCVAEDIAEAVKSGHISGYAGDVWAPQPAPKDHPWREMRNPHGGENGMTAHYSGTSLDAQARYAKGTIDILSRWDAKSEQDQANIIVEGGEYVSRAYGQHAAKQ